MNIVLHATLAGLVLAAPAYGQVTDTDYATDIASIAAETSALPETLSQVATAEVLGIDSGAATKVAEHAIHLFRPAKVGQRMRMRCFGMQEQSTVSETAFGSEPARKQKVHVDFDAEATVLEVGRKGRPSRMTYKINACSVVRDGQSSEIAASGAMLTARVHPTERNRTMFELNGSTLDADTSMLLEFVAGLDNGALTEDDVLGTDRPRAIGESWPINGDMMSRMLGDQMMMRVAPEDLSGASTLADVARHNGHECLMVHSSVNSDKAAPDTTAIPGGFSFEKGRMSLTFQRALPLDQRLPSLSDVARLEMNFNIAGDMGGQPVKMVCHVTQMLERDVTPMSRTASVETDAELGAE